MTPTLRVLLLLRRTVPHAECKTAYGQKKERGFFSKPPLWVLPVLSTGALSEWLLQHSALPLPACLPFAPPSDLPNSSLLSAFPHLPLFLPPFPLSRVLAAKWGDSVVSFGEVLLCLKTPVSLHHGKVIWSMRAKTSLHTTKGLSCVYFKRYSNIDNSTENTFSASGMLDWVSALNNQMLLYLFFRNMTLLPSTFNQFLLPK